MHSVHSSLSLNGCLEELRISDSSLHATPPFHEHFTQKFQQIITPCFLRDQLIDEGRFKEAFDLKPQGIWYNVTFALTLRELKSRPVEVLGSIQPANEIYHRFLEEGFFCSSWADPQYWKQEESFDPSESFYSSNLVLKEDVRASDGISALMEKISFVGCQHIYTIALYLVMIDRMGKEHFDAWAACHKIDLESIFTEKVPLFFYGGKQIYTMKERLKTDFIQAQTLYISNVDDYLDKHPYGLSRGMNLLYLHKIGKEPLFTGLGLDPQGESLLQIADYLVQDYNQDPVPEEWIVSSQALEEMNNIIEREDIESDEKDTLKKDQIITKQLLKQENLFQMALIVDEERFTKMIAFNKV